MLRIPLIKTGSRSTEIPHSLKNQGGWRGGGGGTVAVRGWRERGEERERREEESGRGKGVRVLSLGIKGEKRRGLGGV